jgi:hypothetical protein
MRRTYTASGGAILSICPPAARPVSYENLAGGLASEMAGLLRSNEPRGFSPPFRLVILNRGGAVVFQCEVSKDGEVRPWDLSQQVRRSHFPATVFLTDRSLVTRTFRIERAASSLSN